VIAAAYVHGGSIRHEFMVRLQDLILSERRLAAVIQAQGPYIPQNRNLVCEKFLQLPIKCEWLWFLDVDIDFQPDILEDLLDAADPVNAPIVGALYLNQVTGKPPGTWWPTWADKDGRIEKIVMGKVYELTTLGMGCTLIHRSVIESLAERHKDDPWPWFGHDILVHKGIPERVGEDETFCARAIEAGFSVWGLAELVNHVKTVPIGDLYLEALMSDTKGDTHARAAKRQERWATPQEGPVDYGISTLASEKELDKDSVGTKQ
jgi:hypothetical protein